MLLKRFPKLYMGHSQLTLVLLALVAISALLVGVTIKSVRTNATEQLEAELTRVAARRAEALNKEISRVHKDAIFMSHVPSAIILTELTPEDRDYRVLQKRMQGLMKSYMDTSEDLLQARIIGVINGGREIVRVNRVGGALEAVPEDKLQFKRDTDYFQATLKLLPGQAYVSAFNLNREHGKIQFPLAPVVRSAAPIFDSSGKMRAMVVLNYDSNAIFERIFSRMPSGYFIYIMNSAGDYIYHPNASRTYAFEFGTPFRWQDEFIRANRAEGVLSLWSDLKGGGVHVAKMNISSSENGPSPRLTLRVLASEQLINAIVRKATWLSVLSSALFWTIAAGFFLLYLQSVRRKTQISLEQKRLAAIVSSSSDAIISMTTSSKILSWNEAAEGMFGYSEFEAVGKSKPDLIGLPDHQAQHAQIIASIVSGEVIHHFETVRRRQDGSLIDLSISASPIRDETNQVIAVVESMRDISRQKKNEAEITAMNANLENQIAARTCELQVALAKAELSSEAKSAFVANISHEIRTPMNAVLGMTHMLESTELSGTQRKFLKMLRSAGENLLSLINDILDFSKLEAGRLEVSPASFRLNDMLSSLAAIMSTLLSKKPLELIVGVEPDVPHYIMGDAMRLQQILVNLVGNAIKFTHEGEVALLVCVISQDKDQIRLRFTVRDTGMGISEEQQKHLFSPFSQGDTSISRRFGGTGLGLAITRRLVDLMDGSIELADSSEAGSTFKVDLPLQLSHVVEEIRFCPSDLGHLRILVVDDNATTREYLCKAIASWHWQADSVASGSEAIAFVKDAIKRGNHYGAILIDCQMPDIDGRETLHAIRGLLGGLSLPIILMGGAADQNQLTKLLESKGADAVLLKPITGSALLETLQEAIVGSTGKRLGQQEALQEGISERLAGLHLLLAEDNAMNQFVARSLLEQAGATVDIVDNGQQAIDRLRDVSYQYDMVLMDVQMPIMDGLTATRLIRSDLRLTLPILAMTAGVLDAERAQCRDSGMNDFILKPVEIEQMLTVIDSQRPIDIHQVIDPVEPDELGVETALFDIGPLKAMIKDAPNSPLNRMIEKMVAMGLSPIEAARDAWLSGHPDDAKRALHGLRGSFGTLGTYRFAALALQTEIAIDESGSAEVEALFAKTIACLDDTLAEVKVWLSQQG